MNNGGTTPQLPAVPLVPAAAMPPGAITVGIPGQAVPPFLVPAGGFESLSRETTRYVPRAVQPPVVRRWIAGGLLALTTAAGILTITARIKQRQVGEDVAAGLLPGSRLGDAIDLTTDLFTATAVLATVWGFAYFLWMWGTIGCARRRYPRSRIRSWKLLLTWIIPFGPSFWPWLLLRRAAACDDVSAPRVLDLHYAMQVLALLTTQLAGGLDIERGWNSTTEMLFGVAAALWAISFGIAVVAMHRVDMATSGIAIHARLAVADSESGASPAR